MLVTRSGLNDRVVEFEGQLIKSAPNGTVEVATDTIETLRASPADGDVVGAAVENAITTSVAITPGLVIGNRSANQVTLTVDWLRVYAKRG